MKGVNSREEVTFQYSKDNAHLEVKATTANDALDALHTGDGLHPGLWRAREANRVKDLVEHYRKFVCRYASSTKINESR